MDSMLKNNGNVDHSAGFSTGGNRPAKNPYEIEVGKDKEDLTWLIK